MPIDRTALLIIPENGKHDDAARRIVRAQAARASAHQSRLTRARNRNRSDGNLTASRSTGEHVPLRYTSLNLSSLPDSEQDTSSVSSHLQAQVSVSSALNQGQPSATTTTTAAPNSGIIQRALPLIVSRGFRELDQQIRLSVDLLDLIARTACFNLDSPGVGERAQALTEQFEALPNPEHDHRIVEGLIKLACICLLQWHARRLASNLPQFQSHHSRIREAWRVSMNLVPSTIPCLYTARVYAWAGLLITMTAAEHRQADEGAFDELIRSAFTLLQVSTEREALDILLSFIFPRLLLAESSMAFLRAKEIIR